MNYTHKDLVEIAYKWVLKNGSCGVAFKEFNCSNDTGEQPDVLGFGSWGHSVLIEVKVSRSDFLCDKKKKFRIAPETGMGSQRYYCCPAGLIKAEELPEGWGLIYVNEKGRATKVRSLNPDNIYSKKLPCNTRAEMAVMYSALRRLHIRGRIKEVYGGLPTDEYWENQMGELQEDNSDIRAIFENLIEYSINTPTPDLDHWIENHLKPLLIELPILAGNQ